MSAATPDIIPSAPLVQALLVGCDFHPSWQQVSFFDPQTGEIAERKLVNGDGEAERFYRQLPSPSLVGMEATGNSQWFVQLLQRLGHEVWIGDAAQIRAKAIAFCARCWWKRRSRPAATTRDLKKQYLHRCHSKAKGVAKVAAARKLHSLATLALP